MKNPIASTKDWKEKMEQSLLELTATIRKECVDTKLITIEQWNKEIAPKLSKLSMALEQTTITARTYKLPENYFSQPLNNMEYFKITDSPKLKTSEILTQCKAKFPVYCYWSDEDLDEKFPAPKEEITRYFKKLIEATEEKEWVGISYNKLWDKSEIVSLREMLLMNIQFFNETGQLLDKIGWTRTCSRSADGYGVCVIAGEQRLYVDWSTPGDDHPGGSSRSAVLPSNLSSLNPSSKDPFERIAIAFERIADKIAPKKIKKGKPLTNP